MSNQKRVCYRYCASKSCPNKYEFVIGTVQANPFPPNTQGLKSLVAAMSEEGIVEDLRFTTLGGGFRSRLVSYGGMAGATAMFVFPVTIKHCAA